MIGFSFLFYGISLCCPAHVRHGIEIAGLKDMVAEKLRFVSEYI